MIPRHYLILFRVARLETKVFKKAIFFWPLEFILLLLLGSYLIGPVYAKDKDKDEISELKRIVKDTNYGNYWNRLEAIKKLGKMANKESVGLLVELLGDKEPPIREAAVMALGKNLKDKELVKWFCDEAFSQVNAEIRANAAWVLRLIKDQATLPYLFKALSDKNPLVLKRTLEALTVFPAAVTYYDMITHKLNAPQMEVRIAAIEVLGSIIDARNYEVLLRKLNDQSGDVRAAAVEALAKTASKQAHKDIIKMLKDNDAKVRQAALKSLLEVEIEKSEACKFAIQYIQDPDWRVRATAIYVLRQLRIKESLEPLIQQLEKEKGRLRFDIGSTLKDLTGKSLGYQADSWKKWYKANKDNIEIIKSSSDEPDLAAGETVPYFYEVPIFGENIIFIIDFSGSMKTKDEEGKKKIDIAREELAKTLEKFNPKMQFDIIIMSTEAKRLKKRYAFGKFQPATEPNKKLALDFIASLWDQLEDIKRGRGDFYDTLTEAFAYLETDTIFILSDGKPTYGQYIVDENILENLEKENRYRKIMINTILTGKKGISVKLMERIAQLTGGIFMRKQ